MGEIRLYRPDSCVGNNIKYLVWAENGESYRQRFDECGDYQPQIISNAFLTIVDHNYNAIKKEKIKYPECYRLVKGKKVLQAVYIDHSCRTRFTIRRDNEVLIKNIDSFAADTKYLDGDDHKKHLNINYKINKRTFLYKLYSLTLRS